MKIIKLIILFLTIFILVTACTTSNKDTGSSLEDNESFDSLGDKSTFGEIPNEYSDEQNRVELFSSMDTYEYPVEELVFEVKNMGSRSISFDYGEYLEKLTEDGWYRVPTAEGLIRLDIELVAQPERSTEYKIPQNEFEFKLTPGAYRVVKSFKITTQKEEEEIFLSAQFEIID